MVAARQRRKTVYVLVVAAVLGLLPALIARSKGRSFGLWWLYGFAILIVAFPHSLVVAPVETPKLVPCSHCGEPVKHDATVCRSCGSDRVVQEDRTT
jgi:hypothetical protein